MAIELDVLRGMAHEVSQDPRLSELNVDPSFEVELVNYSRRLGLEPLAPAELKTVLEGITDHAVARQVPLLDAKLVQAVTMELCELTWGLCEGAAARILRERDMASAADKITAQLESLLGRAESV